MLQKLMEPPASEPSPITEADLYDPEPEPPAPWESPQIDQHGWVSQTIQRPGSPLPPEQPMPGPKPKDDARTAAFTVALDILSFRLILLLCVLASAGLFACAALWPDQWRLASAVAFSLIVTGPCMYFYRKA